MMMEESSNVVRRKAFPSSAASGSYSDGTGAGGERSYGPPSAAPPGSSSVFGASTVSAGPPEYVQQYPTTYAPRSDSDNSPPRRARQPTSKASPADAEFSNAALLSAALVPAFLVMLAFGGRVSLLILCFGGVITYIFDLLGAMEATLMTVIITLMAFWGSLLFAGRYLLQDSFIAHIPLLLTFAILLVWVLILISSGFRAVRNEFDSFLMYAESLMFSTLPIACSAIVTWCLCVEMPYLEVSLVFPVVYALYMLLLGAPRKSNFASAAPITAGITGAWPFIISEGNVVTLLALPCIVNPILFIVAHRNVLSEFIERVEELLLSVAVPGLLMLVVAERHIGYWPTDAQKRSYLRYFELGRTVLLVVTLFGVKDHHFFDSMKVFSRHSYLPEGFVFPLLLVSFASLLAAVHFYHDIDVLNSGKSDEDEDAYYRGRSRGAPDSVLFTHPAMTVAVTVASTGVAVLIGTPLAVAPVFVMGALALSEYYLAAGRGLIQGRALLAVALVALGAFPVALLVDAFSSVTLQFLTFSFKWSFNIEMSVQTFCTCCMLLSIFAVVLPAVLAGKKRSGGFYGLLPGQQERSDEDNVVSSAEFIFSIGYFLFCSFVMVLELIVREMDWSLVTESVESVYPSWLFVLTSLLLLAAGAHCNAMDVLDSSALTGAALVQSTKMLHLAGFKSDAIIAAVVLVLSLVLPFFAKASQVLEAEAAEAQYGTPVSGKLSSATGTSAFDIMQLLFYSFVVFLSSMFAKRTLLKVLLEMLLQHSPSLLQKWCACLAVFFAFESGALLVFWRSAAFLRSFFAIASVMCMLVATEAFGTVVVSVDPESATYFSVSLNSTFADEHSGLFLIVSALLLVGVCIGLLPVSRPLPRFIFVLTFTYTGSVVLHSWAFPAMLGNQAADVGYFDVPELFCRLAVLFGSFISVALAQPIVSATTQSIAGAVFFFASFLPVALIAWCLFEESYHRHAVGMFSGAAAMHGGIALAIRLVELANTGSSDRAKQEKHSPVEATFILRTVITVTSSILSLVWGIFASVSSTNVDADFAIPVIACILLCVRPGILLEGRHPIIFTSLAACSWWFVSAVYHIFIRGAADGKFNIDGYDVRQSVFLPDADVSIWTSSPIWYGYLQAALLLVPLPAIYISTMVSGKHVSEDALFALAVVSVVSSLAGQIWCIRLLGTAGLVLGLWRCSTLGNALKISERVI